MTVFPVIYFAAVMLTADPAPDGGAAGQAINTSAIVLALIALISSVVVAVINVFSKKVRSSSDVREDRTAEIATFQQAAETAMTMVGEARNTAAQAVQLTREALETQVKSLNETIVTYKELLSEARQANKDAQQQNAVIAADSAERIRRLEVNLDRTTHERDEAERLLVDKQAELERSLALAGDLSDIRSPETNTGRA